MGTMEPSWVLKENLNTKFNHFANIVFNDFLNLVETKIKTNDTKYGKLLRFLFKNYNEKRTVIFSNTYTLLKEKVTVNFVIEEIYGGRTVGGEYENNNIVIIIAKSVLNDLQEEFKPIVFLQNIVESIKSVIVHEAAHFYQDVKLDALNSEKIDLLYSTNFNLAYSSKIYSYVYLTRSEEISAYMTEANRFFKKYKKILGVNYQQCLCSALKQRDNEERDSFVDLLDRKFDIEDLFTLYLQNNIDLPYYYALVYIFYVFLPKTRFYYLVEDNPVYKENKPDEINDDIANKNRQRIIKMMYDSSEQKKKRQMETALKQLANSGGFHKLFSFSSSNARLINKIRADVLGE